jgi:hypothetical protein
MFEIPAEYDRDTSPAKTNGHFSPSSSLRRYKVFTGICQRALQDESRMIELGGGGRKIDQKMATVLGTLCMIPPLNSNQYHPVLR